MGEIEVTGATDAVGPGRRENEVIELAREDERRAALLKPKVLRAPIEDLPVAIALDARRPGKSLQDFRDSRVATPP